MKEKQIDKQAVEEMAELIRRVEHKIYQAGGSFILEQVGITHSQNIAEKLYNVGYRRQSEGEWLTIGMFDDMAKCSVCGLVDHSQNEVYSRGTYNFCPNCGAKMHKQTEVKDYPPYLDRPKMKGGKE